MKHYKENLHDRLTALRLTVSRNHRMHNRGKWVSSVKDWMLMLLLVAMVLSIVVLGLCLN